jgi:hypothetical protein
VHAGDFHAYTMPRSTPMRECLETRVSLESDILSSER